MSETPRELLAKYAQAANAQVQMRWRIHDLHHTVRLLGRVHLRNWGDVVIHDRVILMAGPAKIDLTAFHGGRLEIGAHSLVNFGTSISASQLVSIGEHNHIGPYCMLMDNDFHHLEPDKRYERPEPKPIVLEDNVWLGAKVFVMRGVTIGEGAAVAAGSLVTKDVPPRTLVAGSPAKVIREL